MIKILYEQKPYRYENVGYQDYSIKTEIELDKDICADDAVIAFMKLLNTATYRVNINTLKRVIQNLEDEGYAEEERVI